jgi:hypothetical protein
MLGMAIGADVPCTETGNRNGKLKARQCITSSTRGQYWNTISRDRQVARGVLQGPLLVSDQLQAIYMLRDIHCNCKLALSRWLTLCCTQTGTTNYACIITRCPPTPVLPKTAHALRDCLLLDQSSKLQVKDEVCCMHAATNSPALDSAG